MINETMHPEAEDLTALLFKAAGQDEEERCYNTITGLVQGTRVAGVTDKFRFRSTEAAADLYSLIAENDMFKLGKVRAVSAVSRCLWINQRRFPHG